MRTTIRLDDDLLSDAKQLAAQTGRTLTRLIEDALREQIARRDAPGKRKKIRLPTTSGRGPLPGVDINDSAGLVERMERKS